MTKTIRVDYDSEPYEVESKEDHEWDNADDIINSKEDDKNEIILFLIMKGEWYWQVFNGQKLIEYRKKTPANMRIKNDDWTKVKFQLGYRKDNVMILDIEKIVETEEEFQIHLVPNTMKIISHKRIELQNS